MKVLTVTNMWPIPKSPYYGIFIKEQVEALKEYHPEIDNRVYFINGKKNKLNYLWSILKINWLITFNKYDVIHIHYALSGVFLLFNPFIKTPVILTLHGSDFNSSNRIYKKIISFIIKLSNDIFYLNKKMEESLKKYKKNLYHIPCGVDINLFEPKIKIQSKFPTVKIAFPASKLRPEKNYSFFKQVIDNLKRTHDFQIEIVEIHGKSRREVNDVLNNVDLLCMTSFSEGSPQIIKEAMSCNTPIVSSNVGDVKDLLSGVNNCFVIDQYDIEEFSNKILQILQIDVFRPITNGRQKIIKLGLDQESTCRKIIETYMKYEF